MVGKYRSDAKRLFLERLRTVRAEVRTVLRLLLLIPEALRLLLRLLLVLLLRLTRRHLHYRRGRRHRSTISWLRRSAAKWTWCVPQAACLADVLPRVTPPTSMPTQCTETCQLDNFSAGVAEAGDAAERAGCGRLLLQHELQR